MANARLLGRVQISSHLEVGLGQSCRLQLQTLAQASGETVIRVAGVAGLDRSLVAFVGESPLALSYAAEELSSLSLHLEGGVARLHRLASQPVKVSGNLVGLTCDLMFGDVVEVMPEGGHGHNDPVFFEVVA